MASRGRGILLEVEAGSLKMKGIAWRVRLLRWRKTDNQGYFAYLVEEN